MRKAARGAAGLPGLGSGLRRNSNVRIYTPGSLGGPVEPSVAEAAGLRRSGPLGAVGAASAYMATFQAAQAGPTLTEREAVSSFAGTDDSAYSSYLAKGEQSFKDGDFDEALREFRMANIIGGKDPESLLSLTHAAFATSVYGYAEAALYLCRALKHFPELPLAKLDVRAFFGQTPEGASRYAAGMTRLEAHLAEVPTDANAKLMLAYFQWFDGRRQEAVGLLEDALRISRQDKNDTLSEAAEIFLDAAQAGDGSPQSPPGAPQTGGTTRSAQPAAEKQPSPGQP